MTGPRPEGRPVARTRVAIAALGVALGLYGVVRIVTEPGSSAPVALAVWLAAALLVHDGVVAPLTLAVGALLSRVLPGRAGEHVRFGLAWAAMVSVVALPLIVRRGSAPTVKALLQQDYALHLLEIVVVIAVVTTLVHAVRTALERRRST